MSLVLKQLATPDIFSAIFIDDTTFVTSCLFSCSQSPFEKESTLTGKN